MAIGLNQMLLPPNENYFSQVLPSKADLECLQQLMKLALEVPWGTITQVIWHYYVLAVLTSTE